MIEDVTDAAGFDLVLHGSVAARRATRKVVSGDNAALLQDQERSHEFGDGPLLHDNPGAHRAPPPPAWSRISASRVWSRVTKLVTVWSFTAGIRKAIVPL